MSLAPLTIRPLVPAEQGAARELILAGLGEHFGQVDYTMNPDLDDIVSHYLGQGHAFLGVYDGDLLVGTGCLVREGEGTGRLVRMSVSPTHRRMGIGRRLVERLLALARERGDRRVLVETNRDWDDARGLYLQAGFTAYAEDEVSVHMELVLP